jgi:flagellar protein FlgJ
MIGAVASGAAGAAGGERERQLREAAAALEGVFMGELLKAMRETVPEDGAIASGAGEAIFTGLLDEHVAALAAARQSHGIGAALFRQLEPLLQTDGETGERVG